MLLGGGSASAVVTEGADPLAAGCSNDAYTVSSWGLFDIDGRNLGRVELRYSPKCGTNWARGVLYDSVNYFMGLAVRLDNGTQGKGYDGGYSTFWSGMVYAPGAACVTLSAWGGNANPPVVTQTRFPDKRICG